MRYLFLLCLAVTVLLFEPSPAAAAAPTGAAVGCQGAGVVSAPCDVVAREPGARLAPHSYDATLTTNDAPPARGSCVVEALLRDFKSGSSFSVTLETYQILADEDRATEVLLRDFMSRAEAGTTLNLSTNFTSANRSPYGASSPEAVPREDS